MLQENSARKSGATKRFMLSFPVHFLDKVNFLDQQWYSQNTLPWSIPAAWKHWLLDKGSLTQRLKSAYPGAFEVKVLHHDWGRPTADERHFLAMQERETASIREVILVCNGEPRVFARSILPATSLEGKNRQLLQLKNRSLGSFLFAQPDLERGPIQLTRVHDDTDLLIWGRRSRFILDNKPLAVCEFFLPSLSGA